MMNCKEFSQILSTNGPTKLLTKTKKSERKMMSIEVFEKISSQLLHFCDNCKSDKCKESKWMDVLRSKQVVNIFDVPFHEFIDICQVGNWFSGFVDNEARAPGIGKVFNTLG